jgi:hypothetical protein
MNDKSKKGYALGWTDDNYWSSSTVGQPWLVIDVEELFKELRSNVTINDNKFGV